MDLIKLLILLSLTSAFTCNASIGAVTELTGSSIIERESSLVDVGLKVSVEMDDEVRTGKGVVGITFDDDTMVRVSDHSELIIDDFVYDPESSSGSLGLLVTMGTVKYTSGKLAYNNSDSVDIQTPSATIAVRGTAFSMTVNELGDSLIVLLPNADGSVGEIIVGTDMGQVILNKAFQLTATFNRDAVPTKPVVLDVTEDMINNLMIISPPVKKEEEFLDEQTDALSEDFLEYEGLDNELEKEGDALAFNELDINELLVDLLGNMLGEAFDDENDGRESGFNPNSGVYTFIEGDTGRVVRLSGNSSVDIKYTVQGGINMNLTQSDATTLIDTIDSGSNNKIDIKQK